MNEPSTDPVVLLSNLIAEFQQWEVYVKEVGLISITLRSHTYIFYDVADAIERLPADEKWAVRRVLIEGKEVAADKADREELSRLVQVAVARLFEMLEG